MKTVANLFSTAYTRLGADHQQDRHFMTIERMSPEEDGYGTYVKSVEGLAQNEYWIAREKNLLMLLKKTPHIVRLRREEEKTNNSYQTVKTKDAGISVAHWLGTKPTLAATQTTQQHPFEAVGAFLNLAKFSLLALKGIHQMGVIHANLRPDNICIPYAPRPYEFDTELKLDYEGLTLIDFMFAISSTLKLSRPLPIHVSVTPSTQSEQVRIALTEDRKNRNTDFIQRIDYSVDLYALGVILDHLFQQNLSYPVGLDAELSMEIHKFIHELKSYQHGIPETVKMHYLHLLPHDDYIARIEHLLALDYHSSHADAQLFTFNPAQFLEDDALFSANNGLSLAPEFDNPQTNPIEFDLTPTASTPIEKTTMKDTMPASTPTEDNSTDNSHIEIDKSVVITLIVTGQLLFFVYQEGNALGFDVSSTLGLILLIGVCVAFAGKLLAPKAPAPRLRPLIIEPFPNEPKTTPTSAKASKDEFDVIAASVPMVTIGAAAAAALNADSQAETTNDDKAPTPETIIPVTPEVAPAVLLKKTETKAPAAVADEDEHIEINKWAVILAILVLQIGFFFLTTDISAPTTPVAVIAPEPVATPEVALEEIAPTEAMPTEPAPSDDAAAANIALLSEASSVTSPQVATATPKPVASLPVADATKTKIKAVAVTKEKATKDTTAATATDELTSADTKAEPVAASAETVPPPAPVAAVAAKPADEAKVEAKTESKPNANNKSLTRGLAEAQNTMGWHYYHGDGVKQDYEESFKWFQKAANLGEPNAQFNVGMMYAAGTGAKQDFSEAARWYKKSAEQGKTSAQLNLGMMYISGRGIRQNLPEGVKWLNKAADQGDTTARANLAWLTQQGYLDKMVNGTPADTASTSDSANK